MFSVEAYSFRQQARLAISLSWVGGFTNVIAYISCQTFASHMTGATTLIGWGAGGGGWAEAVFYLLLVASFLLGAMASALMTESAKRRGVASKYMAPLAAEAILLTLAMLALRHFPDPATGFPRREILAFIALAMGLQNATITKISGAVVRSTHLTGVITDFGIESVQFALWAWDRLRRLWQRSGRLLKISQRHPAFLHVALLASIWASFLCGAFGGTFCYHRFGAPALAAPIAFLLCIILLDWKKPIADIREIDPISDPELKLHGIVHTFLPPELGIYRLTHHRHQHVRTPNFGPWIDRLPKQKRIVILVLSPIMKFNANAILDLKAAIEKLERSGRRLIIAGINPAQYKTLAHEHVVDAIGPENICPDIEFAIAQGNELVRESNRHRPSAPVALS